MSGQSSVGASCRFFFQAEDGIRDLYVTGVQTCALPISPAHGHRRERTARGLLAMALLELEDVHTYYGEAHILQGVSLAVREGEVVSLIGRNGRSEERRVGTERRARRGGGQAQAGGVGNR